ncbi:hypothetical protein, partial [Acidithiobacillus ferrianus]|uniref:hypothetical protein n=1 Tax=Acidithiobacillus ferrianus TaxID=2678518 RepID=UPI0034E452FD
MKIEYRVEAVQARRYLQNWCIYVFSYYRVLRYSVNALAKAGHKAFCTQNDELLPPSLYGYGVSFVLHRGETSTAPHLGRFPP